jgi:N-acetylglutamate synthase-like GNAT family acetyltransferase
MGTGLFADSEATCARLALMVTTRQARADDAGAVTRVVHAAYVHYVARIGQQPAPMGADYVALIEAGSVWVAELAGQIVGVLVLQAYPDHLLIENVAVWPDAQGGGIGTCLLDLAEREAVAAGLGEIRLYTNEAMTENVAYYPRRGFVETRRATEHGFSRVFFRKPVP